MSVIPTTTVSMSLRCDERRQPVNGEGGRALAQSLASESCRTRRELGLDGLQLVLSALHLRTGEPFAGRQQPVAAGEEQYDADGDGGVVERVVVDRAELGQHEQDRDESHPDDAHPADDRAPLAETPAALLEVRALQAAQQRRQHIGDVEADRGDRGDGAVGDAAPQGRDGEEEGEHDAEPDAVRGRPRAGVDAVPAAGGPGTAPSRLKAYSIRELAVTDAMPQ